MTVLPAVVSCPACRNAQLYVYNDQRFDGQWLHCRSCELHGDIIEIAARAWKTDLASAVSKLVASGVAEGQARHEDLVPPYAQQVAKRQRWDEVWKTARRGVYTLQNDSLRQSLQRLGVVYQIEAIQHREGGDQCVGMATREQLQPLRHDNRRRTALSGFNGPAALVIPFYDLPGRICGMLLVGPGPEGPVQIYHPAFDHTAAVAEAGVSMLPAALVPPHSQLGDSLFVLSDPLLALQLQLRWLRSNSRLLPLVASYNGDGARTGNIWGPFAARDRLFWSPEVTDHQITQARLAGRTTSTKQRVVNDHEHQPLDWLRLFKKNAISWRHLLEDELRRRPPEGVSSLLSALQLPHHELREFIRGCDEELRLRLRAIWSQQLERPKVVVRHRTIVETPEGWQWETTGEVICDAVIRIEQIIHTPQGRSYYRGYYRQGSVTLPFVESVETVRKFGIMQRAAEAFAARGGQVHYDPYWNRYGDTVACQLHPPTVITGVDRVGWDAQRNEFRLATFAITGSGKLQQDSAGLFNELHVPSEHLLPPGIILERELAALAADEPSAAVFWATAASVLAGVVAPALGQTMPGTVIAGSGAQILAPVYAKLLGCHERKVPACRPDKLSEQLWQTVQRHDWPVLLSKPAAGDALHNWIHEGGQNCLVQADWLTARAANTRGWTIIDQRQPVSDTPHLRTAATKVSPHYLQDLAKRRLLLPAEDNLSLAVLHDLHGWLKRQLGRTFDLSQVLRRFTPSLPWAALIDVVLQLREEGLVSYVAPDKHTTAHQVVRDAANLWIPQAGINTLLTRRAALPLDVVAVTKSLQETGGLLDETYRHNDCGWLVRRDWWVRHVALRESTVTHRLRVV